MAPRDACRILTARHPKARFIFGDLGAGHAPGISAIIDLLVPVGDPVDRGAERQARLPSERRREAFERFGFPRGGGSVDQIEHRRIGDEEAGIVMQVFIPRAGEVGGPVVYIVKLRTSREVPPAGSIAA